MNEIDSEKLGRKLEEFYIDYRRAFLNVKYYSARLVRTERISLWIEISIALFSSSTITTWALWKDGCGPAVLSTVGALTAVLAILKPFLNLPKTVARYKGLNIAYQTQFYDLNTVAANIRINHIMDAADEKVWEMSRSRLKEILHLEDPEANECKKLKDRCFAEVNAEIPAKSLWMPPKQNKEGSP